MLRNFLIGLGLILIVSLTVMGCGRKAPPIPLHPPSQETLYLYG